MDSFNGAEHKKKDRGCTNNISKIISRKPVLHGNMAGESLDILTWNQLKADEKPSYLFLAISGIYETLRENEKETGS